MKLLRAVLLALGLLVVASPSVMAQRQPVPIVDRENVAIVASKPLSLEQVQRAITTAAATRQWSLSELSPGRMTATLQVRGKHTAQVEVSYSASQYSIRYLNSVNLTYRAAAGGPGLIHPFYNRWVSELQDALRIEFAKV